MWQEPRGATTPRLGQADTMPALNITVLMHRNSKHRDRIAAAIADARLLLRGEFGLQHREVDWLPHDHLAKPRKADALQARIARSFPRQKCVAIVDSLLDPDNIVDECRGISIVTTRDWEEAYAPPPLRDHIHFQLASALANFAADLSDEQIVAWAHQRPVGCLFDFYEDAAELRKTMIAG